MTNDERAEGRTPLQGGKLSGLTNEAELAALLRRETPMTRSWIARRLAMGSASYVSHPIDQIENQRLGRWASVDC